MSMSLVFATKPSAWRRAGSSLALVGALSFALHPTILLAQSVDPDGTAKVQTKAKNPNANSTAKKTTTKGKKSPTDNLSDDLNRRESERVEQVMRGMTSPPAVSAPLAAATAAATAVVPPVAAASAVPLPPTVAAIPARAPIVSASLTPDVGLPQMTPAISPAPAAVAPAADRGAGQFAQTQGQVTQGQIQPQVAPMRPAPQLAQAPAPVPIPPATTSGAPRTPQVIGGAPSRAFGQSQIVPTEPPTLRLEINKGTAIKLPGPAATVFVAAPDIADVQVRSPTMV